MSAKGRKPQPENEEEFHPTPEWCTDTLLESDLLAIPGGTWIEPCAGTGNIVRAVNRLRDDVNWIIAEIQVPFHTELAQLVRPGRDLLLPPGDFLQATLTTPIASALIMNPPFSLTMPFIERAFGISRHVFCLQRTNFFGSQHRAEWLRTYCPDIYSLPKRPSFRSDGSTDSIEYSWFNWPDDPLREHMMADHRRRRFGRIAMLELRGWTPPPRGRRSVVPPMTAG